MRVAYQGLTGTANMAPAINPGTITIPMAGLNCGARDNPDAVTSISVAVCGFHPKAFRTAEHEGIKSSSVFGCFVNELERVRRP